MDELINRRTDGWTDGWMAKTERLMRQVFTMKWWLICVAMQGLFNERASGVRYYCIYCAPDLAARVMCLHKHSRCVRMMDNYTTASDPPDLIRCVRRSIRISPEFCSQITCHWNAPSTWASRAGLTNATPHASQWLTHVHYLWSCMCILYTQKLFM